MKITGIGAGNMGRGALDPAAVFGEQLEPLGFLHISIQQALGLGFAERNQAASVTRSRAQATKEGDVKRAGPGFQDRWRRR